MVTAMATDGVIMRAGVAAKTAAGAVAKDEDGLVEEKDEAGPVEEKDEAGPVEEKASTVKTEAAAFMAAGSTMAAEASMADGGRQHL